MVARLWCPSTRWTSRRWAPPRRTSGVAQCVGGGVYSRFVHPVGHEHGNVLGTDALRRPAEGPDEVPGLCRVVGEIGLHRRPGRRRDRRHPLVAALPPDQQQALGGVDVAELEGRHLPAPQALLGHEAEDQRRPAVRRLLERRGDLRRLEPPGEVPGERGEMMSMLGSRLMSPCLSSHRQNVCTIES